MAFSAEMPVDVPAQGYFIYRDSPAGMPYDPTAPPVFFPPKDSDELFDALRVKFSHVKTHSERMRDAIIEFLMEERQADLLNTASPGVPTETTTTSPWLHSYQSFSSGSSTWSSPETFDLATPSFGNSPQPPTAELNRSFHTDGSFTTSGEPIAPALEQMTSVFSLSSNTQPKQRIRRKMTEEEKIEYRQRRIVKACDKCAKRKRKCHHNQPELDSLAAKSTRKVLKSNSVPLSKNSRASHAKIQEQKSPLSFEDFTFDDSFDTDMQLFDDFTNIFEDSITGLGLQQRTQQWDHTMDIADDNGARPYSHLQWAESEPEEKPILNGESGNQQLHVNHNPQAKRASHFANTNEALHFDQIQQTTGANLALKTKPQPYDLFSVTDPSELSECRHSLRDSILFGDLVCTGHAQNARPRHIASGSDAQDRNSHVFHTADEPSSRGVGPQCPRTALAQVVLKLTGTTKAVRAFGSLLNLRAPHRLKEVSMARVANAVSSRVPSIHGSEHTNDFLLAGTLHEFGQTDQHLLKTSNNVALRRPFPTPDYNGHKFGGSPSSVNAHLPSQRNPTPPEESMAISDYPGMKTNFEYIDEEASQAAISQPTVRRTQKEFGTTPLARGATVRSGGAASTSVPRFSESLLFGEESAAPDGWPNLRSHVEGITCRASPSTEMYRLRRRIPKALHSIVDRNHGSLSIPRIPRKTQLIPSTPSSSSSENEPLQQTASLQDMERETVISRNTECTEGNIHANGGAYLRLDTDNYSQPDPSLYVTANSHSGPESLSKAEQPVHTRSRNPMASSASGETDQRQCPSSQSEVHSNLVSNTVDTRNGGRDIRIGLGRGGWPITGSQLPASMSNFLLRGPETSATSSSTSSTNASSSSSNDGLSENSQQPGIALRSGRILRNRDARISIAPRASPYAEQGNKVESSNCARGLCRDTEVREQRLLECSQVRDDRGRHLRAEQTAMAYVEKKRDTKRYRDHNGEAQLERKNWLMALVVVMAMCIISNAVSPANISARLLLLALCAPVSEGKSAWYPWSLVWSTVGQRTTKYLSRSCLQEEGPADRRGLWQQG